jgi:hypothetical protein
MTTKRKNVNKATTVGVAAGGGGAVVIAYGAQMAEAKYGVPAPVAAAVLGGLFGFVSRWAAKLNPQE